MINFIVAGLSSMIGKLLLLRSHVESKDSIIKEFFSVKLLIVVVIDILLALGLTYLQLKTTNTMNVPTAVELGIAAPLIITELVKSITGRNKN